MAKSYQFIISACEAEKKHLGMISVLPSSTILVIETFKKHLGMISVLPSSTILVETFDGTLDEALNQIVMTKNQIISTNNFDSGKGFHIDLILKRGQRKPAGYDSKRKQIENYYIA